MSLLKLAETSIPARVRTRMAERAKPAVRWGLGHGLPRVAIARASRRGDVQGQLIRAAATRGDDPALVALLEEIRGQGVLVRGGLSHVTVSHAAVKEVLSSNDFSTGLPLPSNGVWGTLGDWSESEFFNPVRPPSLLVTEPPDHTRYRRLVTRVFSARAVEQLRSRTEQIAAGLLDDLDPAGDVDLVDAYCGLLPVTVISEVLGVPLEMRRRILELGGGAAASLDIGLGWGEFRAVEAALQEFDSWLTGHLERLRRDPGEDLLSQLVHAQEDGTGLTEREIKATAGLVLAAGFETTVNLLGNGIALLRGHPEQLERLRVEPELWPNAVDEILRYDPPVLLTGRVATVDTTVAGRELRAGQAVTTVLAGANRDPEVFEDPAVFDIARPNARDHVSFSAGRHYCLGAQLARMEGEVGLRALFDRFPDLELLPGAERRPTRILRGYEHLPARLNGN
ncbi:MAG TPA: cytochrome P450 [Nocardioides sp.]|uniref:cytochrome P450 n=1 Tax=Nocardioides sp. TaxID=35761 RepID=UPI002ED7B32D